MSHKPTIDWSLPIQTAALEGQVPCPARAVCFDRRGDTPIVVLVWDAIKRREYVCGCLLDGRGYPGGPIEFENVPASDTV